MSEENQEPQQLAVRLSAIIDRWDIILEILGLLKRPITLEKAHPYWKKREQAIEYGTLRLSQALIVSDEELEASGVTRFEQVFIALQDFLNVYKRVAELELGLIGSESLPLNHPYYQQRRAFISAEVGDLLHS